MDLANLRRQGVHHLIAYCLNDSCRHQALIDVSSYPGDTLVPWFRSKVKCGKCGRRGRWVDVRPNWKEAPGRRGCLTIGKGGKHLGTVEAPDEKAAIAEGGEGRERRRRVLVRGGSDPLREGYLRDF
jgi:hypothetical protein